MNLFQKYNNIVGDYSSDIRSFISIDDPKIQNIVSSELSRGRLWLGLADIYNCFHNRNITASIVFKVSNKPEEVKAGYQGLLELLKFHRELNEAVITAYGWANLNLGCDVLKVETLPKNDCVCFTTLPKARKELLNASSPSTFSGLQRKNPRNHRLKRIKLVKEKLRRKTGLRWMSQGYWGEAKR